MRHSISISRINVGLPAQSPYQFSNTRTDARWQRACTLASQSPVTVVFRRVHFSSVLYALRSECCSVVIINNCQHLPASVSSATLPYSVIHTVAVILYNHLHFDLVWLQSTVHLYVIFSNINVACRFHAHHLYCCIRMLACLHTRIQI